MPHISGEFSASRVHRPTGIREGSHVAIETQLSVEQWQQSPTSSVPTASAPVPRLAPGIPTAMSAADLMAVLMAKYLRYDSNNPENPNNDHLIFSKGHASSAALRHVPGRRRDHRRRDDDLREARQPLPGPPDAATSLGRCRHRLARPGAADRRRRRHCWQVPRQAPLPRLGAAAATPRWPRAPSGRRSTRPRTTSSTT